ncbi:putative xyloglucan galactosyltransferase GT14 [Citrus sinensis]|nr:putative xyloglucan galactosyltransferase GT14 [Citrus sinensis]
MKNYECLTNDSSLASAIYVPFYAGLDLRRHLWGFKPSVRDSSGKNLIKWLLEKPEWEKMRGLDHFLVSGRPSLDFRRQSNGKWGSMFRFLPESQNMTMLSVDSESWSNDFAIPYPTYFHPSKQTEVSEWQERMRRQKREYLFCFVGATRNYGGSIRGSIIGQCKDSSSCKLLDCGDKTTNCYNPVNVMKAFESSVFCLQPPGDTPTRRSTFDSILAGCIPVFFHPGSAYTQYKWHLPKNHTKYSVFIPEKKLRDRRFRINETLLGVSKVEEEAMREEVIRLIPRTIYGDHKSKLEDAFDLAVKGVLERVEKLRGAINL